MSAKKRTPPPPGQIEARVGPYGWEVMEDLVDPAEVWVHRTTRSHLYVRGTPEGFAKLARSAMGNARAVVCPQKSRSFKALACRLRAAIRDAEAVAA